MSNNLVITVDDKSIKEAFRRAPSIVTSRLISWVDITASLSQRAAKEALGSEVSEGTSGQTLSSIQIISGVNKLSKTVKPTNKYAYWVQKGRPPGKMPPWGEETSLNAWARRMSMNPFLVARHIGKHGTKPHPFMEEAYDEVQPEAERSINATLDEIVRGI